MIPLMLVVGMLCGLVAIGGAAPRTIALAVAAASIAWGSLVGISDGSWTVGLGGTALGAVNAAVGVAVVWAIGWPIRRSRQTSG